MIVLGLRIPQAALDAAAGAMSGTFRLEDVRGAISAQLVGLQDAGAFDYGIQSKAAVHDRCADRVLQKARRSGRVERIGQAWVAIQQS